MTLVFFSNPPHRYILKFVVSDLYPTLIHSSVLFLCATAVDSDLHLQ